MPEQPVTVGHGLRSIVAPIAQRNGVTEMRLFGSRSRGVYRDDSDFDLLITVGKGVTLLDVGCFV